MAYGWAAGGRTKSGEATLPRVFRVAIGTRAVFLFLCQGCQLSAKLLQSVKERKKPTNQLG